jgi:hypothetical protein
MIVGIERPKKNVTVRHLCNDPHDRTRKDFRHRSVKRTLEYKAGIADVQKAIGNFTSTLMRPLLFNRTADPSYHDLSKKWPCDVE